MNIVWIVHIGSQCKIGQRKVIEVMADIMQLIAGIEWIVLGIIVYWCIRRWNRRFGELYDELQKDMEADI